METIRKLFKELTTRQCSEFGLVTVMVASFLAFYFKQEIYIVAAFILSLVTLVVPILFYPFAACWFALGFLLNQVSSRIVLTVIFFVVVVPVAFIRRLSGKDNLRIRQFRKDKQSVMLVRDQKKNKKDLQHTF